MNRSRRKKSVGFGGDGAIDASDIDLLYAQIRAPLTQVVPRFDLTADNSIDQQDVNALVHDILGREFGDADLDKDIDISDFRSLVVHFDPLGANSNNGWARGNFDGDRDIDIVDFNYLAVNFAPLGYGSGNLVASAAAASTSAAVVPTFSPPAVASAGDDISSDSFSQHRRLIARERVFAQASLPLQHLTIQDAPRSMRGRTTEVSAHEDDVLDLLVRDSIVREEDDLAMLAFAEGGGA